MGLPLIDTAAFLLFRPFYLEPIPSVLVFRFAESRFVRVVADGSELVLEIKGGVPYRHTSRFVADTLTVEMFPVAGALPSPSPLYECRQYSLPNDWPVQFEIVPVKIGRMSGSGSLLDYRHDGLSLPQAMLRRSVFLDDAAVFGATTGYRVSFCAPIAEPPFDALHVRIKPQRMGTVWLNCWLDDTTNNFARDYVASKTKPWAVTFCRSFPNPTLMPLRYQMNMPVVEQPYTLGLNITAGMEAEPSRYFLPKLKFWMEGEEEFLFMEKEFAELNSPDDPFTFSPHYRADQQITT